MGLKELYESIGADYEGIMGRLGSEKLVDRFVRKFENDKSYQMLCDAVEAKDYEEAFRGAHTLKGVCQNLGFSNLYQPVSELTEQLRGGKCPDSWETFEMVRAEYEKTIAAIRQLD